MLRQASSPLLASFNTGAFVTSQPDFDFNSDKITSCESIASSYVFPELRETLPFFGVPESNQKEYWKNWKKGISIKQSNPGSVSPIHKDYSCQIWNAVSHP